MGWNMEKFKNHFCMSVNDVEEYVKYLKLFSETDKLSVQEIGDGNINYIFRVIDEKTGKSIVLKQADKYLRSSGRVLDLERSRIEAEILKIQGEYSPKFVPNVYHYDEIMCVIAMEDISEYKNLRKELLEGRIFPNFSNEITDFLVDTLLPTTDLVMDRGLKKDRVKSFINKELCDISECLVFTEPYVNDKNRNIITVGNEAFVNEKLYLDYNLHTEVGKLKNNFMNNAQALIHGDLHSGSIFINEKGIKVIDPEFSFYGPIGYDVGNVIGNLFFSYVNRKHLMEDDTKEKYLKWLENTIMEIFDMFKEKFKLKYEKEVKDLIYKNQEFKKWYLNNILSDTVGMAGLEIIRRVVGDAKVSEVTSVIDIEKRILIERELIEIGIKFIKERGKIKNGKELF